MPAVATPTSFGCAGETLAAGGPLAGSASKHARWLLLEQPGGWGRDAVRESGLPDPVAEALGAAEGFGVLLVRRALRRDDAAPRRVLLAGRDADGGWLEQHVLERVEDLLEGDLLARAAAGAERRDLAEVPPLWLACTHGRRDACCARLGRPSARRLRELRPDRAWESSHLGGHRFAPTVLALPHGLAFGQAGPDVLPALVAAVERGEVPLDRLRGRTGLPPAAQVAEVAVRRAAGLAGLHDVEVEASDVDGERATVRLRTPAGSVVVRLREVEAEGALRLSCTGEPERPRWWEADEPLRTAAGLPITRV